MSVEKIGVKARLREVFSKPSVKAFVLIYLSALGIQLYDSVKNAAFLLFVSLLFFALLYGAVRLTSGIKVEVVPVRMPLIGVITCALIQASDFLCRGGLTQD